ncbi:ATP-binding protein [Nonomuraea aurantiaca]|uniref:ATP-binding protein n=1 Tax=Nonomuraea aurantiaca TaxID=2878562 RepID=UPI001CD9D5D9|nr:helix-turn-helix transcriptional regulator [Nonomuraea aurantiaca]MCA2221989.1 AAA family ATPase [Nonomuraea aurantiaca]
MLYGRGAEQAEIDALLEAARAGRSGAVVVKGETGIGKSALLGYAAGRAAGWPVLRTLGVESETELPFAALHLLLRPVLGYAERLPPGQAAALRGAIGAAPAEVADRFLVGLAALTLLSDLAGDEPILCLVDDAQWLDDASADALLFAARRLDAEGVVMLFALRDGAAIPRPGAMATPGVIPLRPESLATPRVIPPRPEPLATPGVAELRLGRLEAAVAEEFLADRARDLAPQVRRRVLDEAAGNPLALIEFAAVLTPEQRAGRMSPLPFAGESGPLSHRVRTTFEAYINRFPESARAALLVAAADDTGDLDLILRAAARLGATVADLTLAEREELIELSAAGLSFRHPLIRSAAYRGAPYFRRVAAHLALAESLSDQTARCLGDPMGKPLDGRTTGSPPGRTTTPLPGRTAAPLPGRTTASQNNWTAASLEDQAAESLDGQARADRRAWHRAAAATGPDERVAGDLERAALRARDRQGTAAASVAYERAADLTADPARTARRLIAAAELAVQAGQLKRAGGVADRAAPLATTPAERAWLAQVRACVEVEQGSPSAAGRILAEGAEHVLTTDPALAARMLAEAIHYASFAADPELAHDANHRLSALAPPVSLPLPLPAGPQPPQPAEPQPPQSQGPGVLAAGMAVMARLVEGQAVADLSPVRAAARLARDSPDLLPLAASLSIVSGDEVTAHGLAESLVARCREHGLIGLLPHALGLLAQAQMLRGRHREASAAASEALIVASDVHQAHRAGHLHGLLAWLAAVGGEEERCLELAAEADGDVEATRALAAWALGLSQLGRGRAGAALDHLQAAGQRHPVVALCAAPDLVEAAVRAGRVDLAEKAAARFEGWAAVVERPWANAIAARLRGLLAEGDEAGGHFARAVAVPADQPFQQARNELLYGEWLRRAHRRSDARRRLRAAFEAFEALGAAPWARRAHGELEAAGAAAVSRSGGPLDRLTPQERQVVRLAAAGLSNRQIGARLFLSPRTVGHHLYKAFPKLGVASRAQLGDLDLSE